jgi:DnaJ-class molecular chaperone
MGWPYTKDCTRCRGTGDVKRWWNGKPRECPRCEGGGRVWTVSYMIWMRLRYGRDDG